VQTPKIIAQDGALLIVNKEPGLSTTGHHLDDPDCLQFQLEKSIRKRVWALHQLDRDTSGLVAFVTRRSQVGVWQKEWHLPTNRKTYLALCRGRLDFEERLISEPLIYDSERHRARVDAGGKKALTEVNVMDRGQDASLIQVTLRTGRTHQIRVHLAHLGHPLLGEKRYRDPPCPRFSRHALHAWRFDFKTPRPTFAQADPPQDFLDLCEKEGVGICGGS
jgi:23S rRNA pseudouridine1911/1915/1917 synthase